MEAEEVLLLIMKKLKEYKANPKKSTFHEKARQKNLMKMFCIYTSLKKKERAKQKLLEQSHVDIKTSTVLQDPNQSFDEIEEIIEQSSDHPDKDSLDPIETCQIVYDSNDLSTHNSKNSIEDDGMNQSDADNDSDESEHEFIIDIKQTSEYDNENTEDTDCSATPSTSYNRYENNFKTNCQNKEVEGYRSTIDNDNSISIDGFLIKLGEGLKKLPYNQRSQLEIEFLTRLYEVEDRLGVLD